MHFTRSLRGSLSALSLSKNLIIKGLKQFRLAKLLEKQNKTRAHQSHKIRSHWTNIETKVVTLDLYLVFDYVTFLRQNSQFCNDLLYSQFYSKMALLVISQFYKSYYKFKFIIEYDIENINI